MRRLFLVGVLCACGGGSSAAPDASAIDAAPAPIDASAPIDAAPSDAAPLAPTITTVTGASEVRQGGQIVLDITGTELDGITSATVGSYTATVSSNTPTSATLTATITHGAPIGARDLTVTTAGGSDTYAAAVEVTFITASTTGSDGAAGTTSDPFQTVATSLTVAASGDTVSLGTGSFPASAMLTVPRSVTVVGSGRSLTEIRGTLGPGGKLILLEGGALRALALTNATSGVLGIDDTSTNGSALDDVYLHGFSIAVITDKSLTIQGSDISSNGNGVSVAFGSMQATATVFASNGTVSVGAGVTVTGGMVSLDGCTLTGNPRAGVDVTINEVGGQLRVRNTTVSGSQYGLFVSSTDGPAPSIDVTSTTPGDNALSGTVYAVYDTRPIRTAADGPIIQLAGTRLNGSTSFTGTYTGPSINGTYWRIVNDFNRISF